MDIDIRFEEVDESIDTDFGEVQIVEKGGYDLGYVDGYEAGRELFRKQMEGVTQHITALDLSGVTKIADYLFYSNKSILSVEMPDSITLVGSNAFYSSSLEYCLLSKNLAEIGVHAFSRCYYLPWEHLVFPDTLKTIGNYAFWYNYNLIGVTIPDSVIQIGLEAFRYSHIEKVIMKSATPPVVGKNPFTTTYLKTIIVPKGSIELYKSAENWKDFSDYFVEDGT